VLGLVVLVIVLVIGAAGLELAQAIGGAVRDLSDALSEASTRPGTAISAPHQPRERLAGHLEEACERRHRRSCAPS
jgi:Sec-independent protein translocase protein TatA